MSLLNKFLLRINSHAEKMSYPYKAFGIYGLITCPLFYLTWIFSVPEGYENWKIRVAILVLMIPLALVSFWPQKLKKFLNIYWYLTLLYSLPFVFTFLLFKNNFSYSQSLNYLSVVVSCIILLDTLSTLIIFPLGAIFGFLAFLLTSNTNQLSTSDNPSSLVISCITIAIFLFIFARRKEQTQNDKLQFMKSIGASIAHELRTPLCSVNFAATTLKEYLPALFEGYNFAQGKTPLSVNIPENFQNRLLTACLNIDSETKAASMMIDMLLVKVNPSINKKTKFTDLSIQQCITKTLERYPFEPNENNLINLKIVNDFIFRGDELLFTHILFNLLKNSLYYIKAAQKGEIFISVANNKKSNILYFRDSGKGIPASILPKIFDRFYTKSHHGTGIGLAFCKMAMQSFGGDIFCSSKEGEFTEFKLVFPIKFND